MKMFHGATALALALTLPLSAIAQSSSGSSARPTAAASASSGASAAVGTEALGYRSVFDGYRAYREQPVGSWREANDVVRQIGGWQAYAREAQGGGSAPAPAPASSAPPEAQVSGSAGTLPPKSPAASSPAATPSVKVPLRPGADPSPAPASGGHSSHH